GCRGSAPLSPEGRGEYIGHRVPTPASTRRFFRMLRFTGLLKASTMSTKPLAASWLPAPKLAFWNGLPGRPNTVLAPVAVRSLPPAGRFCSASERGPLTALAPMFLNRRRTCARPKWNRGARPTLNCDVTSLTDDDEDVVPPLVMVKVAVPPLPIIALPPGLRRNSWTVALLPLVLPRIGTVNDLVVSPGWNVSVPDAGR